MKGKLFMGMCLSLTMVCTMAFSAFADEPSKVTMTQDKITVTKTAEWTTVNGKGKDDKGNPYAKINFKIDTTQATTKVINTVSKGGSTDVMLVLDISGSMNTQDKIGKAKNAANEFTTSVMKVTTEEVKVGVVSFEDKAHLNCDLTTNTNYVTTAINSLKTMGATNMVAGIDTAKQKLVNSGAKNKIIVLLGDGVPNMVGTSYSGNATTATVDAAIAAKNSGIKIVSIGYDTDSTAEKVLKDCASVNANNEPMYHKAGVTATKVVDDLAQVFEKITEEVESYVVGNSLIDTIPAEFDVVEGTITCNDNTVTSSLSDDKKTITWSWGSNKLEKKVYEMSVVTTLDKTKVPANYFTEKKDIFTNGTTIDTSKDSTGSSIFGYGGTGVMKLTSPKLGLSENVGEVTDGKAANNQTGTQGNVDNSPKTADGFEGMMVALVAVSFITISCSAFYMVKRRR